MASQDGDTATRGTAINVNGDINSLHPNIVVSPSKAIQVLFSKMRGKYY